MHPTSPNTEPTPTGTDPASPSKGVAYLLAEVERIVQELRAFNKRPLPATEEQVNKLINADKDRPVEVPAEQVVEHLMGKTEQLVKDFQALYTQFLTALDQQTRALSQELTTQAKAVADAAGTVKASAVAVAAAGEKLHRPLRVEGVVGFTDWRIGLGCLLGPVVVLVLIQGLLGQFSRVDKDVFEQTKEKAAQLQVQNAALQAKITQSENQGIYYLNQIRRYKAKNPKTTDFPAYRPAEAGK